MNRCAELWDGQHRFARDGFCLYCGVADPFPRSVPVEAASCSHPDVRFCADHRGAVACFLCGRLFGHQMPDGSFRAFNAADPS